MMYVHMDTTLKICLSRLRLCCTAISFLFAHMFAYGEVVETPYDMFSLENSQAKTAVISIKVVKNIEETCRKLGSKRAHQLTSKYVEACSTWSLSGSKSTCTIFTAKDIDFWILGHEVRHCFQGSFHD